MFDVLARITELRQERGWTAYTLSKKSGISQSTFSTWYSRGGEPSVFMLEKICKAFDITLEDFFSQSATVIESETKLAHFRKLSGLSQEELADQAGISVETVCAYEQKKRDISKAQYRIVKKIAEVLDCNTDDIV